MAAKGVRPLSTQRRRSWGEGAFVGGYVGCGWEADTRTSLIQRIDCGLVDFSAEVFHVRAAGASG